MVGPPTYGYIEPCLPPPDGVLETIIRNIKISISRKKVEMFEEYFGVRLILGNNDSPYFMAPKHIRGYSSSWKDGPKTNGISEEELRNLFMEEFLRQGKFNTDFTPWLDTLKASAKIEYLVKY